MSFYVWQINCLVLLFSLVLFINNIIAVVTVCV